MKIGIIVAMQEELDSFTSGIENFSEVCSTPIVILSNNIGSQQVFLAASGIGKANAAMGAAILLNKYDVELVLNVGIAGGIKPGLSVGDVIISEQSFYYDVDATIFGYGLGQVPRMPLTYESKKPVIQTIISSIENIHVGAVCSGDSFLSSKEQVDSIVKKNFPEALAIDMEGAAIAQVCHCHNTPFLLIKGVSDKGDNNSPEDSEKNVYVAMKAATAITKRLLAHENLFS